MLRQELTTSLGVGPDEAICERMDKIVAAVERMSVLIDDLLAFATARARTLRPRRVDLGELVGQVIAEHCAGHEDGKPKPTSAVGPLPNVQVDPSMCRQLLDNLVGNALKYTIPGTSARVTSSSREDSGDGPRRDR